jgi:hypothetical protein
MRLNLTDMKEAPVMATQKSESRITTGIVPGVANLALDVVDRSQSTTIALLQDARTELRTVVDSGIELAEKTTSALFRFARKLTQRIDEGVAETLAGTERLIGGAVKTARDTTRLATDLAQTVVGGVAGQPSASAAA